MLRLNSVRTSTGFLEIAIEMEPEDRVIWVFSLDDKDGIMAFTPYGIECLRDLIREHRRP